MIQQLRNPKVFRWGMWIVLLLTIPSFVLFYGFSKSGGGQSDYRARKVLTIETDQGTFEITGDELSRYRDQYSTYYASLAQEVGASQPIVERIYNLVRRDNEWEDVANFAVGEVALKAELEAQKIRVTDEQVSEALSRQGITRERMNAILQSQGITEYQLAFRVREDIRTSLSRQTISRGAHATLLEMWQEYLIQNEQISVTFAEIPVETDQDYEPTEAELKAMYEKLVDADDRLVVDPEKKVYQYLKISAPARNTPRPTDDQLRAAYEAAPNDDPELVREGGIKVRNIIASFAPTAGDQARSAANARIEQAKARLAGGEEFATVANDLSTDFRNLSFRDELTTPTMMGGILPYALKGDEVTAWGESYINYLNTAAVGGISDIIETPQGFVITKIEDRVEAGKMPFEAARAILTERVRQELTEVANAERDAKISENIRSLRTVAAEHIRIEGMARQLTETNTTHEVGVTSPTIANSTFIAGVGNLQREEQALTDLGSRGMSPVLQTSNGDAVILRVEKFIEIGVKPFEEVKAQLAFRVRQEMAEEIAEKRAEDLKMAVESGDNLTSKSLELAITTTSLEPFSRSEPPFELNRASDIALKIIAATEGDVFIAAVGPENFQSAYYVISVDQVVSPEMRDFMENFQQYEGSMLGAKRNAFVQEFRQDAMKKYKLEYNEEFFGTEN